MKTKLFIFLLGCFALISCNKQSKNEPASPSESGGSAATISESTLKSYFPYEKGDRIKYLGYFVNMTYTVSDAVYTTYENNKKIKISMKGSDLTGDYETDMQLVGTVTDNTKLQIDFHINVSAAPAYEAKGTYSFDASKGDKLPESITLSNGSIIKQNEGLTYFKDYEGEEWNFSRRL